MNAEYLMRGMDTTPARNIADNYMTWDNGAVINVKFFPGGSKNLRDRVKQYAKEWETYANIKFNFVDDNTPNTDVRIRLGQGYGHNSFIGIKCHQIPQVEETMNFDTTDFYNYTAYVDVLKARKLDVTYENLENLIAQGPIIWNYASMKGTVLHEFGHALGLLHEQRYPGAIMWNKEAVYDYYEKTNGWSREQVDFNVFNVSDIFYTNGTAYDPKSIMHYPIEPWQTVNGYSVGWNHQLSEGDKRLIAALYPKNQPNPVRMVPKIDVTRFSHIEVYNNPVKGGLSIYPVFDMKTNQILGDVWIVARLTDANGYYLKDNNDYYNWGGWVATYKKLTLLPSRSVKYNSSQLRDLELFLPYSEMPGVAGMPVMVEFHVILDDRANNQLVPVTYYFHNIPTQLPR